MNLDEYKAAAASTAIYPGAGERTLLGLSYLALGLVGEVSEIAELRATFPFGSGPSTDHTDICHELGDVLWYDAMLTAELGITAGATAVHRELPATTHDALFGLVKASGQVAEIVKKAIRAQGEVSAEKVATQLELVRWFIGLIGDAHGLSIEAIRAANIAKLAARFATDTIKVHA